MLLLFKINDIEISSPTDFNIDKEVISRKGRTASGKLFEEVIAVKEIFNLNYKGIRENKLMELLEFEGSFVSFSYMDLGKEITKEVLFNPFSREQFSTRFDKKGLYWEDINIQLEEV